MDCRNCLICDICKIAQSVKEASLYADVTVNNCSIKFKLTNGNISNTQTNNPIQLKTPKVYKDFREASDELRNKEETPKIKIINTDESLKVRCPNCGAETTQDDIRNCEEHDCLRVGCSNCGTLNNDKFMCSKCWDE